MSNDVPVKEAALSKESDSSAFLSSHAAVARVWAEVLQREDITPNQNFFDLGGDSLKALEVISRLQALLNVELPLMAFFEDPTIAHLAEVAEELRPKPEPATETPQSDRAAQETQATVAMVWSEILQRENIGLHDNFFDLGGDSLKALEVISRLHALVGVELPLIAFFENPSIAHLSAVIEKLEDAQASSAGSPATAPTAVPLSFAQLQYWLLHQADPFGYVHTNARVLRIRGDFRPDILQRALNQICRRHQVLASRIEPGIEEPMAIIDPDPQVKLELQDLSAVPAGARETTAMEIAHEEWHHPFNLSTDLPLRGRLLRLAEDDHVLIIIMHHVVSDGYTGGIFFEELGAIYRAFLSGIDDGLPELKFQYSGHAIAERKQMQGEKLEKEIAFWRFELAAAPPRLWLPTDRPPSPQTADSGSICSVTIPRATLEQAKEFTRSTGSTLFTVLLGALRILLHRWTGEQDIVIGTVASNRSRAGTERMIGCFVNFLPFRNRVTAKEEAAEVLSSEKQVVRDAFAHQDCPFVKIVEATNASRITDASPVYNVGLLLQNFPEIRFTGESFQAELIELEGEAALLDLRFIAVERIVELELACEFRKDLFDVATVNNLLSGFREVLESVLENPTRRISDFAIPAALQEQSLRARKRELPYTLAITSTFTAQPVEAPLAFWLKEFGLRTQIKFAPYNQVFQQLLDPASLISRNHGGCNLILVRLTDWLRFEGNATEAEQKQKLEHSVRDFADALTAHNEFPFTCVCLCPPEPKYGENPHWTEFLGQLEQALAEKVNSAGGSILLLRPHEFFDPYPIENYWDEYSDKLGHIPYTLDFFTALATVVMRRILARHSEPKKIIALDGDGTLWKGKAGEGIRVEAPQRALQEFVIRQLEEQGMLVCLCAGNSQEEIDRTFDLYPEMPLRLDHIIAQKLGRESASSALRELAGEFQFDLASFVFLSADSQRCREVRAQCPEVLTCLLPADSATISSFLGNLWVFDARTESIPDARFSLPNALLARIASELQDIQSIRRAIDLAQMQVREPQGAFAPPRTPTEELLAGLWGQVLKLDRVGIHDNFFLLGGHSLLATQVVARVRQTFGIELPLRAIFEAPTIAQLAKRIEAARTSERGANAPLITRCADRNHLPLSFAQQRLWFLDQFEPGSPFYNMPRVVRMRGKLDTDALHRAVNKMVERHESLRTTFALEGSAPVQVIADKLELPLPILDLSGIPDGQREQQAQELAREEAQRPFNLSTGPVMRAQILRLAPEDHLLLWTMHHIVSDRWSMGIVAEELAAHYAAFVEGKPSPLPDLAIQYADFALWQRQWLEGEVLQGQLDYWKKQLGGASPVLELPTDHARPPELSVRGGIQSVLLSRDFIEQLTALSRTEGVTLFMTLLAAFQTLLWRYCGQEDIVVGSPIANRTFAEIEPLIGFFVNTIALRGNLSGNPTFRELLARTREVCFEAYAHQDIPFEKLVEELQPERSLSHSPIFQVMFALQNAPMQQMELPGLTLERVPTSTLTSMFDMSWFVNEVAQGYLLYVEYATDLFEDATIVRALGHFQRLLESVLSNPERRISELAMLAEDERHKVLVEFNQTQADFPRLCIHNLLEESVERWPDRTALVCGERRTSYRELNQCANQIAHHLIRLGAGPDILVGIFMERTPQLVAAILGILKSGSAYVPLDPGYPRERLATILADSKAPIVLTQESLMGQLGNQSARFVAIDSEWEKISEESRENPETDVTPDNLAYVLFTSGSTGRPKGVALEHHNNVTFVQWAQTVFTCEELAGVLFATSIGFDMSTFELFITLAAGGKVILAENALYLPALPAKDEVTLINTVPSAIAELARINALPESLQTVALAGEALPGSLVEEIYRTGTVKKVYNLYGPTESGYSTWTLVPRGGRVTIGKPIANEQCYILDKDLHPVPVGVPGELYLAGEGLARGYFGRPDLTSERFIANPFGIHKNSRMYKTGDLCRWLADGNIDYLGRIDHQVKLRGFRIELGEIEAVLAKHAGVRHCLVTAREDQPGLKRLVAYLVRQEGTDPSSEELAAHLKQSLPEYMIPSGFVTLDAFPLTPNGKIDRKALPAPEYKSSVGESYVAPRTPMEEKVAAMWAEVLHVERVSATDDFFAVGGHSLLAAQVISRLRQVLEIEIPLKAVFESPKLEVLAARLQAAKHGLEIPPITRVMRGQPLPASFAQQRLWFLDQFEPNNPNYNIPWTLKISGTVNVEAIEQSLNAIAARHESLRTVFSTIADQPVQIIHDSVTVPFRKIDLSGLPEHARDVEAKRLIGEDANRPFDLTQAPLVRFMYIRLSEREHYLLLNVHHTISDRWSMGILSQELADLYEAAVEGRTAELPELPLQYADYTVWQKQWLEGEALEKQLAYWREKLKDVPPRLDLPTDRPRQTTESFNGDATYLYLSRELTDKLKELGRQHGATLFMTLLAGLQALLSRHSGQDDVVVGTAIANRTHPDLEKVIGFFLNTLPLRTRLDGDPSFVELLARTKETSLGAYAHQDMPFEKLVEELNPERSLSHSPLVQVFFVLQNAPVEEMRLKGLRLKHVPSGFKTVKGDMYLSMHETPEGLEGRLEYSTDLFDTPTVERLLEHFRVLLEGAATNPELRLSELPLLTETERRQILVDWNASQSNFPRHVRLHELFEQQVARTPDAVACIFEKQQLSYRELNQRANQVAHYLKHRGVGPEVLVGISVERSLDMLVGILGILKAGGAYVPLDPAYPKERLGYILEDSKAAVVLTQESLISRLPPCPAQLIPLDSEWQEIRKEPSENLSVQAQAENLAYVLFTSGSTGRPKGVALEHRSAATFVQWAQTVFTLQELAGVLFSTSMCFDLSVFEMFVPLSRGGKVIIAQDALHLPNLPARDEVTLINTVPSAIAELVRSGGVPDSVKVVNLAGEALPAALVEQIYSSTTVQKVYNLYGPTEDTTYSTFTLLPRGRSVTIGKPISDTQSYILDGHGNPLPIGVSGELHLAGSGLARGYYGRADLTAERFVPNPFSATKSARMYRTGDLCRWLANGEIEYLGRLDHQVKIRGFRIELGEIENALAQHPAVRQVVVVAREDTSGDKRLVGYVAPHPGSHMSMAEARAHLKQTLPDYMVPAAIVEMEALPLTPNGKVDRKRLPAPDYGALAVKVDESVRTLSEEVVAGIWAEVLKLPRVGPHDNFFELGGHSLLATRVVSRLRQAFKIELPLRTLFEAPTIAELAQRVEVLMREKRGLITPGMRRVQRDQPLPLSFSQQRLWFLDQLEPGNPLYNIAYVTRMSGPLNPQALEQSVNEIVRRHESLRTVFPTVNDQPMQVIVPKLELKLAMVDTRHLATLEARETEARKLATKEMQRPFDLATGPLVRGLLVRVGDEDHALILNTHHIISDRWSLGVLSQEMAALYQAYLAGRPSPLPELEFQYADYAAWQREFFSGEVLEKQLAYWRHQLDGAPPVLELPVDRARKGAEQFWGAQHRQAVPPELATALRTFSRQHRGTFFMTLLAGFQLLLSKLSGQTDVVVGTDLANRNQLEAEKMIGFFVNLLPMRARIRPEINFTDFFFEVRESSLEAMAHQDIPFDKLVEELRPERTLTHNPLVQVLFVMQNTPPFATEFGGLKLGPLGVSGSSRFDLVVFINNPETEPSTIWVYNPNLFDQSTIAGMAQSYELLLKSISGNSTSSLKSLFSVLEDAEQEQRGREQKKFQEAGLEKLRKIRRRPIEV